MKKTSKVQAVVATGAKVAEARVTKPVKGKGAKSAAPVTEAPATVAAAAPVVEVTPTVVPPATVTTASPIADRVAQAIAYIQLATAVLALDAPALTTKQRRALGTVKKGGEKFIPQIGQLAQQWSVQIRTQPIDAMTSSLQLATALQPLATTLTGFLQEVDDTGAQAQGASWSTASALYSLLKRMSRKDPKLKAQLEPVQEFFAYRRPVATDKTAAPKAGKESRRDAKKVAAAEEVVAANGGAAASPPPGAPSTASPPPLVTVAGSHA